jgi:uncharacterized protein with PQ loop repeat
MSLAHVYMWDEYTLGQKLAWIFSTVSNGLWLFVFIPQLYQNYKNKNSNAISLLLLFCLILGDIFSIISAHFKQLNIVIIYAAAYHIILDIIIIGQILYYRRQSILSQDVLSESTPLMLDEDQLSDDLVLKYPYFYLTLSEFIFVILSFFIVTGSQIIMLTRIIPNTIDLMADIIAWSATFIFILARLPQIVLNFKRQSTEGLSLLSFIIINIANMFFLVSVLILLIDLRQNQYIDYIKSNIQWIVGSSSTTLFDCIIFYQFYKYRNYEVFEYNN